MWRAGPWRTREAPLSFAGHTMRASLARPAERALRAWVPQARQGRRQPISSSRRQFSRSDDSPAERGATHAGAMALREAAKRRSDRLSGVDSRGLTPAARTEAMLQRLRDPSERTLAAAGDATSPAILMERERAARRAIKKPLIERVDWLVVLAIGAAVAVGAVAGLLMVPLRADRDLRGVMVAAKELRRRRREAVLALRRVARRVVVPSGSGRLVVHVTDPPPAPRAQPEGPASEAPAHEAHSVTVVLWAGGDAGPGEPGSVPLEGGISAGEEDSSLWGLVHAGLAARADRLLAECGIRLRVVSVHRERSGAEPSRGPPATLRPSRPLRAALSDLSGALRAAGAPDTEGMVVVGEGVGAWLGPLAAGAAAGTQRAAEATALLPPDSLPDDDSDLWLDPPVAAARPAGWSLGGLLGAGASAGAPPSPPSPLNVVGMVGVCPRLGGLEGGASGVASAVALSRVPGGGTDAVARARDATSPPIRAADSSSPDKLVAGIRDTDVGSTALRTARAVGSLLGDDPASRSRDRTGTDVAAWSLLQRLPRLSDDEVAQAAAGVAVFRGAQRIVVPAAASLPLWMSADDAAQLASVWTGAATDWVVAADAAGARLADPGGAPDAQDQPPRSTSAPGQALIAAAMSLLAGQAGGRAVQSQRPEVERRRPSSAAAAVAQQATAAINLTSSAAAVAAGTAKLEDSGAARAERSLAAATAVARSAVQPLLALGPDEAAWGRSIAADGFARRAIRAATAGTTGAAAEAGWVGAHSIPLQLPECVVHAAVSALLQSCGTRPPRRRGDPPSVWRPGAPDPRCQGTEAT